MSDHLPAHDNGPPTQTIRPLEDSLPIRLLALHDRVMHYFRPMLHTFGMTDQQWRVLRVIAVAETDFRALAQSCLIQPASLSRMLEGLETRGLVTRRPAPGDKRQRRIALTPQGRALFEAAAAQTEACYRALEADLGPDFAPLIATLNGALDRLEGAATR